MKKFLCFLLAALLLTSTVAMAETVINPTEKRGIKLQKVGLNEVEEGISPTTGLPLSFYYVPEYFSGMALTGEYLPFMVQIGNDNGGIGEAAPWGVEYADIVYEMPLHKNGTTRLTFLFNDLLPDDVGPVRSLRVAHAWLREEWNAPYAHWGMQTYNRTNVENEIRALGHKRYNDMFFDGTAGEAKPWKAFMMHHEYIKNNVYSSYANPAALTSLIPEGTTYPNHAFKFTDETPEGDTAMRVTVSWHSGQGDQKAGSLLVYDIDSNAYLRYIRGTGKNDPEPWVDRKTGAMPAFANVVIQFAETSYNSNDAPVTKVINKSGNNFTSAEGNADFFMCGVHIAGYWKRDDVTSRTVFYGPDGNEIEFQRGKTLIMIMPSNQEVTESKVSYE